MDTLGLKIIPAGEQYMLYGLNISKLCDSMPGCNTMRTFYFSTWEMARDAYITLQYFIINWDRGYHGGELGSGVRRGDPFTVGEVPINAIGSRLFTRLNAEELINQTGGIVRPLDLIKIWNELNTHTCNVKHTFLPKGMYDENILAVIRYIGFPPRIKRQTFSFNPFKYDYDETDENTVRQMGLVVKTVNLSTK